MRAITAFTIQAGAAIIAAKLFASIIGASAAWLTTTATAACLLWFLIRNGGWQCCNCCTEAFWQAKRHCADARQTLDVFHIATLIARNEAHGDAFTTRTCGATNAVHILFRHIGQFKIEHMADTGNVNAARRNIRCDKDLDLAIAERL